MSEGFGGCHGLVPWRLTFIAKVQVLIIKSIKRETPRRKAVASKFGFSLPTRSFEDERVMK
jgi:hypothetical protein